MSEKDAYIQKLKAQLAEWNAEIDKLEAKAGTAKADARLHYEQQVKSLRQQRQDAQARLEGLEEASDDAWTQLKDGVDKAWAELKSGLDKAADAFR